MTVRRLIELLERYDENAEVRLMGQESWPFENAISGICERADFTDPEEDLSSGRKESDVFLVEGKQLCYGNKDAWDCARR